MFVFRILPFIVVLKCLITFTYSDSEISTTLGLKDNEDTQAKNIDSNKFVNVTYGNQTKENAPVIAEGGVILLTPATPLSTTTVKSTTKQLDINTNNTHTPVTRTYGREGEVIDVNKNDEKMLNTTQEKRQNASVIATSTETMKPVTEKPVNAELSTIPHSRIVPKKGVDFNETINNDHNETTNSDHLSTTISTAITQKTTIKPATKQSTTIEKQPRKPTVTTGSEDNRDALAREKSNNSTPKVPTIEYYQKKKEDNKRSTFIIPIVAVILSVPLVAIIINILYKRGKEWWSHRHYRRMDFLIDGMYNN